MKHDFKFSYMNSGKKLPWWKGWVCRVPPDYFTLYVGPIWKILPMRVYYKVKMVFWWLCGLWKEKEIQS